MLAADKSFIQRIAYDDNDDDGRNKFIFIFFRTHKAVGTKNSEVKQE